MKSELFYLVGCDPYGLLWYIREGRRGRMVVGFTTTCVISVYYH